MNQDGLQTSFWLMVLIQTIGSVDMPGRGERKLPAPRQYVAIFVAWMILGFVSGISASAERATAAFGWLLVVVGMVAGPFGTQVTNFLGSVSKNFSITAITPPTTGTSPSPSSPTTPGSVIA